MCDHDIDEVVFQVMSYINFFTWEFFIFHFATLSFDWHMNCDFLTKPEVADFIEAI